MERLSFTVSDLAATLGTLADGALHPISYRDFDRLFGCHATALDRLRSFATSHSYALMFSDARILFQKERRRGD